ncbi:MAG: Glu/Leu/Phe/Val dehydrogenase [Acidimicrobiia bacterium]|nr:Glu/Leu/Phe/Val dehydrogenase [Acidimicrobiia bacterium]
MGVFSSADRDGHTHVLYGADDASGLRAIIAIHSTALGPALGGTRFYPYTSDQEALRDVLRLSKGMTLKNSAAGLDHGGGKAVIIGDPRQIKTEDLLLAYGRLIESLGGRYVTAEDVGTTIEDMECVRRETRWVTGTSSVNGGSGDPSPATALGLFFSLQAAAGYVFGSTDLRGRRVAVQGVGKVGMDYVGLLVEAGAEVLVADAWEPAVDRAVERFGVKEIPKEDILFADVDILSPCALGAVFDVQSIPKLNCRLIVGSANNQLATDADAQRLAERNIVYVPDFVANAGGVINVADELHGYKPERAIAQVQGLGDRTLAILESARALSITPNEAAVRMAMARIEAISTLPTR